MSYELSSIVKMSICEKDAENQSKVLVFPCSVEWFEKITSGEAEVYGTKKEMLPFILKMFEEQEFTGKEDQVAKVYCECADELRTLFFVGVGDETEDLVEFEFSGGRFAKALSRYSNVAILGDFIDYSDDFTAVEAAMRFAFGVCQKSYHFSRYLTTEASKKKLCKLTEVQVMCLESKKHEESVQSFNDLMYSITLVRDAINEPPNVMNTESFADLIVEELEDIKNVKVSVLDENDLESIGMHMLLAVGQASVNRPRVVVMEYKGNPTSKDVDIALIGKGVMFDSGGLSLKPSAYMEDMKCDMSGAATVVGSLRTLANRSAKLNAVAIVGLVENSVSGNAQRPGDVVKSLSGLTVEVLNTDAEGRLVLGDILHYACKEYKPKKMIDFATLTGAISVCVGDFYAGLFTDSGELAEQLDYAGRDAGEEVYRLPMGKKYDKLIDSSIADMRNTSTVKGVSPGSTTAAHFLKRFVTDDCKDYAHLDIASVAFDSKCSDAAPSVGATGFGVKLIDYLCKNNIENEN